ncbi:UDP-N-acetylmuramate dehydrogenase [Candidatus Sumerlaeota bacterium]|nr:UDP-N-acetylmuramate dehydrogenase [Candidatus Sumerlaeota bacterium]
MADAILDLLNGVVADVRPGEPLSAHTTVRVGGPARVMAFPSCEDELAALFRVLNEHPDVRLAYIGGGANLFADSRGVDGVVVSTRGWRREFALDADGLLAVGGGMPLRDVALEAAGLGWGGIDFMAEVPGTVGGAVVINAGTNVGGYVADRFEWVETIDRTGMKRRHAGAEMEFGYRTSRLLHGPELIVRAAFRLARLGELGLTPETVRARFDATMRERESKFPLDQPNFGSTFRSPGAPHPPAGKLIDDLGMKGLRIGGAEISRRHANFIVNLGGASSDDILALMTRMHEAVLERSGVALEPEVHYLADPGSPRPAFFPA